jgi:hypothetical protein
VRVCFLFCTRSNKWEQCITRNRNRFKLNQIWRRRSNVFLLSFAELALKQLICYCCTALTEICRRNSRKNNNTSCSWIHLVLSFSV